VVEQMGGDGEGNMKKGNTGMGENRFHSICIIPATRITSWISDAIMPTSLSAFLQGLTVCHMRERQ
jgi:hypothetical protein